MTDNNKWILSCPQPKCGKLANGYYNAGPILEDDRGGPTKEDTLMQVVCGVTKDEFVEYTDEFKAIGARCYFENKIADDLFFGAELNGKQYHITYSAKRKQLRVTEDEGSMALDIFEYSLNGEKRTILYPYALYYGEMSNKSANCGMLYFIRLSDNSLFVIDAGHKNQHSKEATEGIWNFMKKITDTPEDGKVRISCWYFTHGHDDHTDGCMRILTLHSDQIILERVMHGFPSYIHCHGGFSPRSLDMRDVVRKKYPDILKLKLHTGQKFSIADMTIEVLYTVEDTADANDLSKINVRYFNATSTIIKLSVKDQTMMILGDTDDDIEKHLEKWGHPEVFKSDMVQVAHHCFNYLPKIYKWISAPMASIPQVHISPDAESLKDVLQYIKDDRLYYSGEETRGFEITENGFKLIETYPIIGTEFDFSWN